jgi:hypothetical protein
MPLPRPASHALGEGGHPSQHGVHSGHHVFAVRPNDAGARRTQRHVQDGAILGGVDRLAPEHRIDARTQVRGLCQVEQQTERLVGDPILGIIQIQTGRLECEAFAPLRVLAEERPQMERFHLALVFDEGLPSRQLGETARGGVHRSDVLPLREGILPHPLHPPVEAG